MGEKTCIFGGCFSAVCLFFYCTKDKKNQLEASEETEAETCPCISCPCFYSVASLAFLSQINLSFLLPCFSFGFFCFSFTSTRTYNTVRCRVDPRTCLSANRQGGKRTVRLSPLQGKKAFEEATTCNFSAPVPLHFLSPHIHLSTSHICLWPGQGLSC